MFPAGKIARRVRPVLACALAMAAGQPGCNAQSTSAENQQAPRVRDVSMDEYRQHLQDLTAIVSACAGARDAQTCDPGPVGSDDSVAVGAERHRIPYDWLRALLAAAREKDQPAKKPASPGAQPPPRPITELLKEAETRLAQDLAQTNQSFQALPAHARERETLSKVLAQPEFRNLDVLAPQDTILERIADAINRFFDSISRFGARSPWIGLTVKWGFLTAVCVGLVWALIRLERRWRIRLAPAQDAPAPEAASARDWQLWLEDARRAAAAGKWREAVHYVYWAAISRLESKRLWPADRARTPREYLALVAEEDPRKAGLATLTRSFERIWYGGREAAERDYRAAEEQAEALISSGGGAA
jgi:hypothetical protein